MKIKKIALLSVFAAASALQVAAQEQKEEAKFLPHWYLQLQAGADYTLGEAEFKDLLSPAVQLGVGYQFNPYLGARIKANGWQAKGGWVTPAQTYKFNQVGIEADARLDLTNLIGGYKPKRIVSVGLFAGIGANMAWGNDEAQNLPLKGYKLEYLWDGSKCRFAGNGGVDVNFRVSKRVSLGLEANAHVLSDRFNSKKADNADWMFNALVGVTYRFGYKKAPQPQEVWETRIDTTWYDDVTYKDVVKPGDIDKRIFFEIRESDVASTDAQIEAVAKFLREVKDAEITITAYADRGTGNPEINMGYSQQRAEKTKAALIAKGVDPSIIKRVEWKGDTVQPYPNDNDKNRVSIITGHGVYKQQEKVVNKKFKTQEVRYRVK